MVFRIEKLILIKVFKKKYKIEEFFHSTYFFQINHKN